MAESNENNESKTEDATPHKREELRKKGKIAQSKEIGTAIILLVVPVLFYFYGSFFMDKLFTIFQKTFSRIATFRLTDANVVAFLMEILGFVAVLLAPILLLCMVIGLLVNVMQTGIIFTSETLKFDIGKINPLSGFKRIFSMRSGVEAIKAILKLSIIGSIVYIVISGEIEGSIILMDKEPAQIISFIGMAIFKTVMYVAFLMMILAIMDFVYQRLKFEKDIRMTKQEVKEELKDREGDPHVKARIKRLQRQMATKRMMSDVPKAQVIITNPTHLAIAIEYNKNMGAPKVVAKGADYLAEKIRKIAREHDIPLVENKPLAQTLYKSVKVGQFVPENLYNAVAEVLVYVMRVKNGFQNVFMGENGEKPEEGAYSV